MNKIEELYREQIEHCKDELYTYLETILDLTLEAMKVHEEMNHRENKLKEYLENETF